MAMESSSERVILTGMSSPLGLPSVGSKSAESTSMVPLETSSRESVASSLRRPSASPLRKRLLGLRTGGTSGSSSEMFLSEESVGCPSSSSMRASIDSSMSSPNRNFGDRTSDLRRRAPRRR